MLLNKLKLPLHVLWIIINETRDVFYNEKGSYVAIFVFFSYFSYLIMIN